MSLPLTAAAPLGDRAADDALAGIDSLLSPLGGAVSRTARLDALTGDPDLHVYGADLGDLSQAFEHVAHATAGHGTRVHMNGAGSARDHRRASRLAAVEGLERYAACVYDERQFVWATATELGKQAIDLDTIPRCSSAELASPACLLTAPDPHAPLRWVRGISLSTGAQRWVPAMMVFLYIVPESAGERIWLPISTGCAAHTDVVSALLNALCEVIERDSIALTWLQRPSLPELDLATLPAEAVPFVERNQRLGMQTTLYDATTDVGVPTVYCLEVAGRGNTVAQLVTCATALDPDQAVLKVLREASSTRIALSEGVALPDSVDEYHDVMHGATYMARPEHRDAFSFLERTPNRSELSRLPRMGGDSPSCDLATAVRAVETAGMEAVAIDLTTDEAQRAGFRVVRVVVPGLQPLSFSPSAQFKGHPRLYDAARRLGWLVHPEEDLNPWPQPFA